MKPRAQQPGKASQMQNQGVHFANPAPPNFPSVPVGLDTAESAGMKRRFNSCPDFTKGAAPGKPVLPVAGGPGYPQLTPLLTGEVSPLLSSYASAQAASRNPQMLAFAAHPMLKVAEAFALVAAGQAAGLSPNPFGVNPNARPGSVPIAPKDGAAEDGSSKKLTKTRGGDVANSKVPIRSSSKPGEAEARAGEAFQANVGYGVPFSVGSSAKDMRGAAHPDAALERMNQIKTIMSCPDMVTYYERIQLEDSRRRKKLERNRASARLRRLRKKNLVAAHEEDTGRLEKAVELLKAHKWGSERSDSKKLIDALREGKRKANYLKGSGRRRLLRSGLRDQQGRLGVIQEEVHHMRLLKAAAGKEAEDPEVEDFAKELRDVLKLDDEQKARIGAAGLGGSTSSVKREVIEATQPSPEENPYRAIHDLIGLNERRPCTIRCSLHDRIAVLQKSLGMLERVKHLELHDFSTFVEKIEDVLTPTQVQKTVRFAQRNHASVKALYKALCQAHLELGISNLKDEEAKLEQEIQIKCDEALREFDEQQMPAMLSDASKDSAEKAPRQQGDGLEPSALFRTNDAGAGGVSSASAAASDAGAKMGGLNAALYEHAFGGDLSARNEKILQYRRDAVSNSTRGAVIASRIEEKVLRAMALTRAYPQPIRFTFDAPAAALSQVLSKVESTGSLDSRASAPALQTSPKTLPKTESASSFRVSPDVVSAPQLAGVEETKGPVKQPQKAPQNVPLAEPALPQASFGPDVLASSGHGTVGSSKLRSKSTPNFNWKVEDAPTDDIPMKDDSMELEMLGLDLDFDGGEGGAGDFYREEWLPWIDESSENF